MGNGIYHDFQERLEYSASLSDEAGWVEFYRRLWPDMLACIRIDKDSQFQRWGIDREILLPNGKRFSVDEKKREKDYGDILLEEFSVCEYDPITQRVVRGIKAGWSIDASKRCDFIAYSIPAAGKCWLLPFEILRQACLHNFPVWKMKPGWYPKAAKNNGYYTMNVAVPWGELKRALFEQMHRKFGNASPLPIPSATSSQLLLFEHGAQACPSN